MPVNRNRLVALMKQHAYDLEERCDGYRDAVFETVADIIVLENEHMYIPTNIQQKIDDKCDALATFILTNAPDDTNDDKC